MKTGIMSKKLVVLLAALLMVSVFAVGCLGGNQNNPGQNDDGTPRLSGTVTIAGSTSVQPISEELAFVFMDINQGVRVEVMGGGSGAGIRAAETGTADIGASSRDLRPEELANVNDILMAIDGIAVITHPDNPVNNLSFEDLQGIFTGEITNWSQVGGANAGILVVNREEGSGTRGAFDEIVIGDGEFTNAAIIQNSTGAVREAVSNDANGIGYISIGGINDSIKPLTIDGIAPTVEMLQAEEYPVARPFIYIIGDDDLSEVAQAFLDFVLSVEGQRIVQENGLVPVR